MNDDIYKYLSEYITEYNQICRKACQIMTSPDYAERFHSQSAFVTYLRTSENILSRTAGTIVTSIKGRKNALYEHKKYELKILSIKIENISTDIEKLKNNMNRMMPKVTVNTATSIQLRHYRLKKNKLYRQQNKLNKLIQQRNNLQKRIDEGTLKMSFGGREMFKKQFRLKENHFAGHAEWYKEYCRARDKNIDYIGGAYYMFGNDICRMSYDCDNGCFNVQLRKEKKLCGDKKDKYIEISGLHFHNLSEFIRKYLAEHENSPHDGSNKNLKPLSYRIGRENGKWFLQVMIRIPPERIMTSKADGVIALKYCPGYIKEAETDRAGNLVGMKKHILVTSKNPLYKTKKIW